jgi:hypothetical protein
MAATKTVAIIASKAGYQLGTKLTVNNSNSRIGINLTQKGPLAGVEFSFWQRHLIRA